MKTGVPLIDLQHDATLNQIDRLRRGEKMSHALILSEIAEYALVHFATEEYMLALAEYPGLAEHRAEHNEFRRRLALYCTDAMNGKTPEGVLQYLTEWWDHHVMREDAAWADWRRRRC